MKSRYLSRLLRIPLLLFASRCAEHRREKERESERRKKPFLPLAHSSFIHRRVEYTFRNCRPPVRFRSFVYSYVQRRRRRRRRQEHLLARITSRFPRRHAPLPPSLPLPLPPPSRVVAFLMNGASDEVKTSRFPHSRRKPHLTASQPTRRTTNTTEGERKEGGGRGREEYVFRIPPANDRPTDRGRCDVE